MTGAEIRGRLRQAFRTRIIPRDLPMMNAGTGSSSADMIVGGGSGHPCSACGDRIGPQDQASVAFRYPDRTVRFHGHCEELWRDERETPTPR